MPFLVRNLSVDYRAEKETLFEYLIHRLSLPREEIVSWKIIRKGLDARKKNSIRYVYTVEVSLRDEVVCRERLLNDRDIVPAPERAPENFFRVDSDKRIVIAGMGPAGLFAALRLSEYGLAATIVERGRPVAERVRDVRAFMDGGTLDPESNVQFGEGGAGTFSDGKLTTRIRDENLGYILEKLVRFGAPSDILTSAKPHIGTDKLRGVVAAIRRELFEREFDLHFSGKLTDILIRGDRIGGLVLNENKELPCDYLVLATGHSARDTYAMLRRRSIMLESKPFAIGLRVEHPQELINCIQYGKHAGASLPPAEYSLAFHDPETDRPVYSFCMCPGGTVIAAASEEGGVVTNGMSSYLRDSLWANSALVVSVGERDFADRSPLSGVDFQRHLERRAYVAAGSRYHAPAQNLVDFVSGRGRHAVHSTYRPGTVAADLADILPRDVGRALAAGIRAFDRKMRGFLTVEASLTGVETRTSSPLRVVRGEDLQSVSLPGLFPTGEGAGYAGGIMSAAADGIRVADRIAQELRIT